MLTWSHARKSSSRQCGARTSPTVVFRFWGRIILPGELNSRILRVVTLEDGKTIHNAFLDRRYREDGT